MRIGMVGLFAALCLVVTPAAVGAPAGPYAAQVAENVAKLRSDSPRVRAGAAEALGFLRAYGAERELVRTLSDPSAEVRRAAALALAWCGGRRAVGPLITALGDRDWAAAQGAWVALTNITGMEFPFDALAPPPQRRKHVARWKQWWASAPADAPPPEVLGLLQHTPSASLAAGCPVRASTTYKGPPDILTDGDTAGLYWQTKNVAFPQWVEVDLEKPATVCRVVVHQYGRGYCMTDYALSTSLDGKTYQSVVREKRTTEPRLAISFPPRPARCVRITSYASERPLYPTTFREIEISDRPAPPQQQARPESSPERALRALGALGGKGAAKAIMDFLERYRLRPASVPRSQRLAVRAGLRALGRLGDEPALPWLASWLSDTNWARYAADALGDLGHRDAAPALIAAYPEFARSLKGRLPAKLPRDDRMGFPSLDRMFHTPYIMAYALARLPLDDPQHVAALRGIAPLLATNLPQDYDGAVLYEPEVGARVTRRLVETAGLRQEACEAAFEALKQPRRVPRPADAPAFVLQNGHQAATWLPVLCAEPADVPRLAALLGHKNGWVRLNAAKALGFLGSPKGIEPLTAALAKAKPEAAHGYSPRFIDEEFNDPAPRVREGLVRALGLLGGDAQVPQIAQVLRDEGSVLEVRYAAAEALAAIGTDAAHKVLRDTAAHHPYMTVRHVAREALWLRGHLVPDPPAAPAASPPPAPSAATRLDAIVFIKGDNALPNHFQNDHWRQTYVTTDTGPTYRPGRNLYVLRPPRPDGQADPLTHFADGYVADLEVSWDGRRVVFSRRAQKDPWWHVWEIRADGTGLRQLTDGPYHDIGPATLPDGRIVFASSRIGTRDEYHAYLCTALHVMHPDGSDIRPIATNVGRDNEPAILPDGRIAFSRLEVFYSRLKTELTLHAAYPDGTHDVVLYGPERRSFWHRLRTGPRGDDYASNVYATHRILRMTQPQGLPDGRIVCATQGGLALLGPERTRERIIPHDPQRAFTTPWPLPDGRILCASTLKEKSKKKVDLGIYTVEPETGELALVYNDPATADYEARPLAPRPRPVVLASTADTRKFTGTFLCLNTRLTQEAEVPTAGRLVRVVEGLPIVSRHSTQTNPWEVWRNHQGTVARVLGTAPLAADGSFYVEVPADRLLQFQVLDSDRRVVGNLLTWVYARPGERRSCVGCHEPPDTTPPLDHHPQAVGAPPIPCLPAGDELRYRAKAWLKGHLPAAVEERLRTVRAVNLLAR